MYKVFNQGYHLSINSVNIIITYQPLSDDAKIAKFFRIFRVAEQIFLNFGLKMGQKYSVLTRILKKTTFKSLLLIDRLTVLAENLHKGTSQECKKFDGSGILNFSLFGYL